MRDILVTFLVLGSLPIILSRPYIGVIVWSWLGYMNPHRLCWGFATTMPFAQIVAIFTLLGMLLSNEPKRIPWTRETILLIILILWMCITTFSALEPNAAFLQLEKVLKIQLMTFVTLMLITDRKRLYMLIWAIVLSIGFFSVKGGIFTIVTGGGYHLWGPPGTFIDGNNELGLVMLMTMPLMRYLQLQTRQAWIRYGLIVAMFLTAVAVLGTQSRGALVGFAAVALFFVIKSPNRFVFLIIMVIAIPIVFGFMPETWWARMETIQNYSQDGSVQGRFNAWGFAHNLALDRFFGGGFEVWTPEWFSIYAPVPDDVHDAHSIYFEVLGEHGFIGLGLFLLLGVFTWNSCSRIKKDTYGIESLKWASDLARMLQVSLVAYAVCGAFLGLAYFDLYYHLIAITVICKIMVTKELVESKGAKEVIDSEDRSVPREDLFRPQT